VIPRRALLQQLVLLAGGVALGACASSVAKPPQAPPAPEPLRLPPLPDLVAAASLMWIVIARPKELTSVPSLAPGIQRLAPDSRRALFERASGIRIDRIDRVVVASYPDSTLFLLEGGVRDPLLVERLFRERWMTDVTRSVRRHDLVIARGKTATGSKRSLAALGSKTVAIESGSWLHAKVAALYAEGKLHRAPRALELPDVPMLVERLGDAPLLAIAPGPFEGDWQRALRGVLGVCTAAAGSVRPDKDGTLRTQLLFAGDWTSKPDKAIEHLLASWQDLSQSSFGRLTGLDTPREPPRTQADARIIGVSVDLDGAKLVDGLYAAVSAEARDITRW